VPESGSLYFTNARAIGSTLTGYTSGSGVVAATDTILQAIQKLNGNVSGLVTGVSSVFGRTGAVVATSGDYNTSQVTENTNLYYTEGRVSANTDVAANTAARHAAVTIGTANGLSLSTQALSLAAASTSVTGALTSTDWNTFNNKLSTATAASTYVTYTGATGNVTLGTNSFTAGVGSFASSGGSDTFAINHSSGSGIALNITKGGNGEGLYINKTSGSGNAATIIGTLNATTLVKSGGTSSQFLKADGSVDSSTYLTTSSASSTYLPLAGGTLTGALSGTSATFSGNVGIGNTASCPLDVTANNSTAIHLRLRGRASDNIGQMEFWNNAQSTRYGYIAADSTSMGISTTQDIPLLFGTNTTTRLTIASTGAATFSSSVTAAQLNSLNNSTTTQAVFLLNNTSTNGGYSEIRKQFSSSDSSYSSGIRFIKESTGANYGSSIGFLTETDSGSQSYDYAMYIKNRSVGIGTSSPTNNLSILGADQTSTPTLGTNAGKFGMFNGVGSGTYGMIMGVINNGNSYIQVQRIDGTATAYNLLLQPSGGNVGIGTSSTSQRLSVVNSDDSINSIASFSANNLTQATEIWYAGIRMGGTATNVDLSLASKGAANIIFSTNLTTERMRITSGGNVDISNSGIGNDSGDRSLNIYGSLGSANNDVAAVQMIQMWNGSAYRSIVACQQDIAGGNASSAMVFKTSFFNGSGVTTAERMRITSSGDFLVGKTSNSATVEGFMVYNTNTADGQVFSSIPTAANSYHVYDVSAGTFRFYVSGGGTINATNTTISSISDVRLKENISDLEIGLDAIMALRPRKFDWKKESGNSGKNIRGFIAQEFEEIFPDLIDESLNKSPEGESYKQIRQDLIPVLVKAIQELKAEIEELKNK
jgi:hypothetical protein